jgi:hypothetical protein
MSQAAAATRLTCRKNSGETGRAQRAWVPGRGFKCLGRRLVPHLIARGHRVTATTTRSNRLGLLEEPGADGVVVNGLDGATVGEAVARGRAVQALAAA